MVDVDRGRRVAIFMLLLDITVVNVALPEIQRSLHSSFPDLQWVVNAYSLTLAAFLLTAGALADLFGRKRVFVIGLVVFTGASARVRALVEPADAQPRARRPGDRWRDDVRHLACADRPGVPRQGARHRVRRVRGVTGAAVAVGPLVGGVITTGIGWEWIFFVNVPIGIVAVVARRSRRWTSRAIRTPQASTGPAS